MVVKPLQTKEDSLQGTVPDDTRQVSKTKSQPGLGSDVSGLGGSGVSRLQGGLLRPSPVPHDTGVGGGEGSVVFRGFTNPTLPPVGVPGEPPLVCTNHGPRPDLEPYVGEDRRDPCPP